MATVALSGYLTGMRFKTGDKPYMVLDVLQFGDRDKQSVLVPILVYEYAIQEYLNPNYTNGEIKLISLIVKVIYTTKKDLMWVCERIISLEDDIKHLKEEICNSNLESCYADAEGSVQSDGLQDPLLSHPIEG